MDDLPAVAIVSSEMVLPAASGFDPPRFELTAFDRIMKSVPYQKRMLFFQAPIDLDWSAAMGRLREGLREALAVFYPLAGRIRSVGERLELDCTQELGVKLSVAETTARLSDLPQGFEPSKFCDSLCDVGSPEPAHPWTHHNPLVFVQMTRFRCGGISLGVAFSHQAMDGISAWRFISCWAKLARSGLDRRSLSKDEIPDSFYSYRDESAIQMSEEQLLDAGAVAGVFPSDSTSEISMPLQQSLRTKTFKLDRSAIENLKIEAGITASDGKEFTTYEAVVAYFWKKVTIARSLPPGSGSHFILLASARGRIKSISSSYFGNAVSYIVVSTTVEALDHEPLSHPAELLHRAIVAIDEEKCKKSTAFLDHEMHNLIRRYKIYPFSIAVSSPRHPIYECDFGFARPIGSSFGTNDLHEGKFYLFPSAEMDGGIDVTVVLPPEAIERIQC